MMRTYVLVLTLIAAGLTQPSQAEPRQPATAGGDVSGGAPPAPLVYCDSVRHLPYYSLQVYAYAPSWYSVTIEQSTDVAGTPSTWTSREGFGWQTGNQLRIDFTGTGAQESLTLVAPTDGTLRLGRETVTLECRFADAQQPLPRLQAYDGMLIKNCSARDVVVSAVDWRAGDLGGSVAIAPPGITLAPSQSFPISVAWTQLSLVQVWSDQGAAGCFTYRGYTDSPE